MSYLEDLAYERDSRTRALDDVWWDAISGDEARIIDRYTESGTWIKIRFEVCPLCNGRGKHVNPSIDAHGLSQEDFDEDPDFRESYFAGDYDVRCNLCEGEKVVPVPLNTKDIETIEEIARDRYESWAESYAERMVGA